MYGEKALALVKEINHGLEAVPSYNARLVQDVCMEILHLIDENKRLARANENNETGKSYISSVRIHHAAIQRNMRCLLAYHYNRIRTIRDIRWDFGSIIPADIKNNLSLAELNWFKEYNKILANFMKNIGDGEGVNLCVDATPPKTLYCEVRCTTDYGDYELMDGTVVHLKKGNRYFLLRRDCEEFIRRGIFLHISGLG